MFLGDLTGLVTVDGFESLEFSNFGTLVIDAGAGSDEINLNNPTTPTALTDIEVNGGDPTAAAIRWSSTARRVWTRFELSARPARDSAELCKSTALPLIKPPSTTRTSHRSMDAGGRLGSIDGDRRRRP